MSEIDWSKAPEWATKYGTTSDGQLTVFYNDVQYQYTNGNQQNKIFNGMNGRDINSLELGVKGVDGLHGVYLAKGDVFITTDGSFCVPNCSNIKPLTVEIKQ